MDALSRVEQALACAVEQSLAVAVAHTQEPGCPPRLAAALRYSVFPGGARIRPRLALAVACACGEDNPEIADAAAASIELLHCASLVHDDLPCFDDAPIRRGKPSVHRAFGERIAVLAGDALIVLAFQTLARGAAASPRRLAALVNIVARAVGMPGGIVAGQAWESESHVGLAEYQRAKTGVLFGAATMAGAESAGAESAPWRLLGERLGEAFQVADDLRDVLATEDELGKPIGQDKRLGRPSAVSQMGVEGATTHLKRLITEAVDSIPQCSGAAGLKTLIQLEAQRFLPPRLAERAA
ncbi:MAG: polyprenyl synthetase family protein [Pseudomonadota bacterium]|jgi:geranylgeranyl diphosphate synthase type II